MGSFFSVALWLFLQFPSTGDHGWRMEGFNPSRTNVSTVSGPNFKPEFEIIASNVPGSLKRIADDGSLILSDGETVSSYTKDGQIRWRTNVLTSLYGPVVDVALASSGIVYVSSATQFVALDPQTGLSTWPQPVVTNSGDESGPLVVAADGTIYFHTGSTQRAYQERLTAINPDGTRKWEYTGNASRGSSRPVFNSDESMVYLPQLRAADTGSGTVVGLSGATGQPVFETPCDVRGGVYAYSRAKVLYTGDVNNNLLQFPADTQNCTVSTSGLAVADTAAVLNSLFVIQIPVLGTGTSYAAVDTQGRRIWSRIDPLIGGFADNGGERSGTFFAIAPQTNEIVAIRISTGEELWRQQFAAPVTSVLLGGNGSLYAVVGTDLLSTAGAHFGHSHTNKEPSSPTLRSNALRSVDTGALVSAGTSNSGLVAAYSFNDGTGTTVADLSGNRNTGTISNATWTASGKYGNALVFNGTSSIVTINDSDSLHLTTGMTLEAWVNPVAAPGGWVDVIYKQNDNYLLEASSTVGLGGPTAAGTFGDGLQSVAGSSALTLNTWTHVAVTFDGANLTVWVNGVNVASQPQTSPLTTSILPLQVGGDSIYGQYFTGTIDEVRIYNRALSKNEIEGDMNSPIAPPTPPANLTATASGGTQINLSWTASTSTIGILNYLIERCTDGGFGFSFVRIGTSTTTTYTDTGLNSGFRYCYRVRASDTANNLGGYSNTVTATTIDIIPPTDPANLTATVIDPSAPGAQAIALPAIHLAWTPSSDEPGEPGAIIYQVERCEGAGCSNFVPLALTYPFPGGSGNYENFGLVPSTSYSFRVRALDDTGNRTGYTNVATATTPAGPTPPSNAELLVAFAGGAPASIIAWQDYNAGSQLTTHTTAPFDSTGGDLILVAAWTDTTVTTMSISDGKANAWISAAGPTSHSSSSVNLRSQLWYAKAANVGTGHTVTMNLSTPGLLTMRVFVIKGSNTNAPIDATSTITDSGWRPGYEIRVDASITATTQPGDLVVDFARTMPALPALYWHAFAGFTNYQSQDIRTEYAYHPVAHTADWPIIWTLASAADYQNVLIAVVSANAPLSSTQITVTWTPSLDAVGITGYFIERCAGSGCSNFAQIGSVAADASSYTDTTVSSGATYSYRVRATNAAGNLSPYSSTATATTTASGLSAPTNLSATASRGTQVNLAWTASTGNVTGYQIERCQGAGCITFAQLGTSTSYSDTGLAANASYSYRVRAIDAAGNLSRYSNTASATTTIVPPTAPANLTATASGATQINLSWTASTSSIGIFNYLIERCQPGLCSNFVQIGTSPTTTYTDTGLASGITYSYRVRASDTTHTLSGYSNTATTTTKYRPVAAYSFNEGTGTTVADLSGNGNTGTISNATWTTSGKYGKALVFDGTSSIVTINDSPSLHLTTGMTLEAWVYPTAAPGGWVDVIYKQNDNYLLEASSTVGLAGPTAAGTFGDGFQSVAGPSALDLNTWTHVAVTFDGANLTVWVNGVSVASLPQTAPLTTSTMPLHIGGDSIYGQYFTGTIDEVRIYNRALSKNEIEVDMNSPIGE